MISNDRQLATTRKQIVSLQEELKKLQDEAKSKKFGKTAVVQTQALIKSLQANVDEYEALTSKGVEAIQLNDLSELMILPMKYRIAKKMTQEMFAKEVDIPLRTIARYEADEYKTVSGDNLHKILSKLKTHLKIFGKLQEI
jgi:DNA-binding XRE family transcriptional regulator